MDFKESDFFCSDSIIFCSESIFISSAEAFQKSVSEMNNFINLTHEKRKKSKASFRGFNS